MIVPVSAEVLLHLQVLWLVSIPQVRDSLTEILNSKILSYIYEYDHRRGMDW
jgi:hypothetical protein